MNGQLITRSMLKDAEQYSKAMITWDRNPLFDTEGILGGATAIPDINYFSKPIGQAYTVNAAAVTKTAQDTNLREPSQIGSNRLFILTGFYVQYRTLLMEAATGATATALHDLQLMLEYGLFEFSLAGGRGRLTVPLSEIGCGLGPIANVASAYAFGGIGDTNMSVRVPTNGKPSPDNIYRYCLGGNPKDPGVIEGDMNFKVKITFPVALSAASISAKVYMDGILGSIAQ
jgi:hypothetical protein